MCCKTLHCTVVNVNDIVAGYAEKHKMTQQLWLSRQANQETLHQQSSSCLPEQSDTLPQGLQHIIKGLNAVGSSCLSQCSNGQGCDSFHLLVLISQTVLNDVYQGLQSGTEHQDPEVLPAKTAACKLGQDCSACELKGRVLRSEALGASQITQHDKVLDYSSSSWQLEMQMKLAADAVPLCNVHFHKPNRGVDAHIWFLACIAWKMHDLLMTS